MRINRSRIAGLRADMHAGKKDDVERSKRVAYTIVKEAFLVSFCVVVKYGYGTI